MYDLEKIKNDLKSILSEKRYTHSLGVMEMAARLARTYHVSEERAMATGLLHDIAKEMKPSEMMEYVKKNKIRIDIFERRNIPILHGKIGADISKKKYNIDDSMKLAIEYHTTTDKNMDMLAKIIYVADKIEMNRKNERDGIEYERELAFKDIDIAILHIINGNIEHLIKKGKIIHPKSIVTRNNILMKKQNIIKM